MLKSHNLCWPVVNIVKWHSLYPVVVLAYDLYLLEEEINWIELEILNSSQHSNW
jgi:hypothetical protein